MFSVEYFSHDQLKLRVNGNNCGDQDPVDQDSSITPTPTFSTPQAE